MPTHANAPLTPEGRRRMVLMIERGASLRRAARQFSVAVATAHRWWHRFLAADPKSRRHGGCFRDRSSRPHRSPRQLTAEQEAPILAARRQTNLGPGRLAHICRRHRSTIYKVLARHGMGRRPAGPRPIRRRYEWSRPGALLHLDTAKLSRFRTPGHRTRGRSAETKHANEGMGYSVAHVAIDDHSRYAYVELHRDERGETCARFAERALAHFAELGMEPEALISDRAMNYRRSRAFQRVLARRGIRHILTPPYSPWWNGKCERFIQTLKNEWAQAHEWPSSTARARALSSWVRTYNRHRRHSSLGDRPPISRVPNVCG